MSIKPAVCVLCLSCLLSQFGGSLAMGETEAPSDLRTVDYRDIPSRVQIIGKLGRPLWDLVTVRGRWVVKAEPKPTKQPVFEVTQVNGKALNPPAVFADVEPVFSRFEDRGRSVVTEGEVWEIRGFETGGFVGVPLKVWGELGWKTSPEGGMGADVPPIQLEPSGFMTKLCYLRARRIDNTQNNEQSNHEPLPGRLPGVGNVRQ